LDDKGIRSIAKRFFGSELAMDFSTYEGKALAAKMIQDRGYVKECLVLCDWIYPIADREDDPDYVGDPALENKILSAVMGEEIGEEDLCRMGERVFNLQRAILVREGHKGRQFDDVPQQCYSTGLGWYYFSHDCLVPGKEGEVISRKGAVLQKDKFEKMKDEYYRLRRWDEKSGLQRRATLEEMGLGRVGKYLYERGLAV
jgi:aldehyde:ferredoxin oxidoreductase